MKRITFLVLSFVFLSLRVPLIHSQTQPKLDIQVLFHLPQTNYWTTSIPTLSKDQPLRFRVTVTNGTNATIRAITISSDFTSGYDLLNNRTQSIELINAGDKKSADFVAYPTDKSFGLLIDGCSQLQVNASIDDQLVSDDSIQICGLDDNQNVLGVIAENPLTAVSGYEIYGYAALSLGIGNLLFAVITASKAT